MINAIAAAQKRTETSLLELSNSMKRGQNGRVKRKLELHNREVAEIRRLIASGWKNIRALEASQRRTDKALRRLHADIAQINLPSRSHSKRKLK
jgi:hypothetical protein